MSERATKKQRTDGPRITDPRFANIQSDPRYRLPGKKNKVKLDQRFARVLQDDDFVKRAKVDRYGRPLESNAEKKRLKRKYEFDEENELDNDEADDDDEVQKELSRVENRTRDVLREGRETDSESEASTDETSTDDESEEDEAEDMEEEMGVGQSQQDIPTGEVTSRVALVNLDWDNIRAADLMAVFSSFLPPSGGSLLKVSIYPSEFGKERLEREEMEGPPKEIFANTAKENNDEEDDSDEEEGDEDIKKSILKDENGDEDFNPTALRKYQLERLRYFYAILTFSSPSAAKQIYDAVDGAEYLHTANFFDLRFVPDDTDFSSDTPREECERMPDDYRPNEFVTDALQHSKVKLTWDAEDTGRKEAAARAFKSGKGKGAKGRQELMDENDLQAYLASDASEDDEEDVELEANHGKVETTQLSKKEAERQRMRSLLGLPLESEKKSSKSKEKAPVGDMQITFTSGLGGRKDDKKRSVFENSPEVEETTVEKYVRKERERKQKRKDKMKANREGGDTPDADAHEPAEQAVHQDPEAENEDQGFDDPFFAEPAASSEKTSKTNKPSKEERLKKKKQREAEEEANRKQRAELELLMADDDGDNTTGAGDGSMRNLKIRHFDMREIARAEKEARRNKKGKKKHNKKSANGNETVDGDDFNVDTSDPRFSRLFSSHEYAIDPTNPRFQGTRGMKALLDEGRARRKDKTRMKEEDRGEERREKKMTTAGRNDATGAAGDVKSLVEKIKRRQGA